MMTKPKENFGDTIRKRRLELDKTQQEVAQRIGVAQNFIAYLENNTRKPSVDMVKKLSDELKLPSDKLYFLANREELKGVVDFSNEEGKVNRKISPVLAALAKNRVLRDQYQITDAEIDQLSSIRGRGEISTEQDYVFLLMTIRQVFR
jgi:transcriptional regulator with XRE-family HTH domain